MAATPTNASVSPETTAAPPTTLPDSPANGVAQTTSKPSDTAGHHDGLKGRHLLRQVFVGVAVSMMTASMGAHATNPAVLVPRLTANDSDIPLNVHQATWFASMHSLSAMFGSALAGPAVHRLGPRRVLLLQALPTVAGWLLMALAVNFPMLMVARCLVGSASGFSLGAAQVYLGESSSPQMRARLVCVNGLMNNLGGLLSYVCGYLLPWRWVVAAPVFVFVLPSLVGLLFVPESPYWLLGRRRHEQARRSLKTLRGDDAVVHRELQIIAESSRSRHRPLTVPQLLAELRRLPVLVPFLTITALFVLRIFAGISAMVTYTVAIFEGTGSALNGFESAVVFGCVRAFNSVCCVLYVSERFGRRPLLMFSGVGCTVASLALAAFLFGRDRAPAWPGWQQLHWLPLPMVLLWLVAFDYGYARTGWVVHSEILPNRVRSTLSGVGVFTHNAACFLAIFSFPYIREAFTLAGALCTFAVFSFLGLLLTIFFIPETKNQRLEEIEAFYVKRFGGREKESNMDVT